MMPLMALSEIAGRYLEACGISTITRATIKLALVPRYYIILTSTRETEQSKMNYSQEIERSDLNKYPNMVITGCGEENMYFTHNEKKYFCKCV